IPFRRIPLTEATNPVKLFEYLATGKPIVARNLPELEAYGDVVSLYDTPDEFVHNLELAVADASADASTHRVEVAKRNTWAMRGAVLDNCIDALYDKASIVIVTFSNREKTLLTLKSILGKTRYPNYEIIVVDNGGRDDIRTLLQSVVDQYPRKVKAIFNRDNV